MRFSYNFYLSSEEGEAGENQQPGILWYFAWEINIETIPKFPVGSIAIFIVLQVFYFGYMGKYQWLTDSLEWCFNQGNAYIIYWFIRSFPKFIGAVIKTFFDRIRRTTPIPAATPAAVNNNNEVQIEEQVFETVDEQESLIVHV